MELRHNQAAERRGYMDAVSRSSRGFDDDDNDGEEFTRREASSSLKGWFSSIIGCVIAFCASNFDFLIVLVGKLEIYCRRTIICFTLCFLRVDRESRWKGEW